MLIVSIELKPRVHYLLLNCDVVLQPHGFSRGSMLLLTSSFNEISSLRHMESGIALKHFSIDTTYEQTPALQNN